MLKYITLATALIATPIVATTVDDLTEIQNEVNSKVEFRLEENGRDIWRVPTNFSYGDCEDFALLKRQMLIDKGWNPSDLVLIMVHKNTPNSNKAFEGHIALLVKSKGLVLDSTQVNGPKRVEIVNVISYVRDNNYRLLCHVKNISTDKQVRKVSDRCKGE